MLLEGKKLLVTGVLTRESIAYAAAQALQEQGAEIVLTSFGRAMGLTEKSARRLPEPRRRAGDGRERSRAHRVGLGRDRVAVGTARRVPARDRVRAAGRAGRELPATRRGRASATAIQTSAYSLKAIATGMLPHMREHGGAIVSLDFDARVAWPIYDWMGVAKASLESITRYLARDLGPHGIRVNTLSAGPAAHDRGQGDPGVPDARRRVGRPGAARVEPDRRDAGRRHDRVPAVGSVAGDHRRDGARRRRLPRDRGAAGRTHERRGRDRLAERDAGFHREPLLRASDDVERLLQTLTGDARRAPSGPRSRPAVPRRRSGRRGGGAGSPTGTGTPPRAPRGSRRRSPRPARTPAGVRSSASP